MIWGEIVCEVENVVTSFLPDYNIHIITIHRPPSYSEANIALLIDFILEFNIGKEVIIQGNLNLPIKM